MTISLLRELACVFLHLGCCYHRTGRVIWQTHITHAGHQTEVQRDEVQCCRCQWITWRRPEPDERGRGGGSAPQPFAQ